MLTHAERFVALALLLAIGASFFLIDERSSDHSVGTASLGWSETHGKGISQSQVQKVMKTVENAERIFEEFNKTAEYLQKKAEDHFGGLWGVSVSHYGFSQASNATGEKWVNLTTFGDRRWNYYIWQLKCDESSPRSLRDDSFVDQISEGGQQGKGITDEQARQLDEWIKDTEDEEGDMVKAANYLKQNIEKEWGDGLWVVSIFVDQAFGLAQHISHDKFIYERLYGHRDRSYMVWKPRC